jgi:hypothetical protein
MSIRVALVLVAVIVPWKSTDPSATAEKMFSRAVVRVIEMLPVKTEASAVVPSNDTARLAFATLLPSSRKLRPTVTAPRVEIPPVPVELAVES